MLNELELAGQLRPMLAAIVVGDFLCEMASWEHPCWRQAAQVKLTRETCPECGWTRTEATGVR
jgi:hypothetical protein